MKQSFISCNTLTRGEGETRHVIITGGSGSGKTIVLLGLVREHMKKQKDKGKERVLVLTTFKDFKEKLKLVEYLDSETKDVKGERRVMDWDDLLKQFNIDQEK